MIEIIDNLEIYGQRPCYWIVGSCFGGESERNQLSRFENDKIWEDGWGKSGDERNKDLLSNVKSGDYFLLKSFFAQNNTAITRLKLIGKVHGKSKDNYFTFLLNWDKNDFTPKDFHNISYWKTIELAKNDALLEYAKSHISGKNL